MNNHVSHKIPAFTIFEVTVVLAIMSILITMISISVNRLGEQLKVNTDLQNEITDFYQMRNTLWYDCMLSDSIVANSKDFTVFREGRSIRYFVEDDLLSRTSQTGSEVRFKTTVESYENLENEHGNELVLRFEWKSQPVIWRFLNKPNLAASINSYFEHLNE